jgi:hypothetical protein
MMGAMSPIMAGDGCVGFILGRGISGVEAFDREVRALGVFASEAEAAKAVLDAAERERGAG